MRSPLRNSSVSSETSLPDVLTSWRGRREGREGGAVHGRGTMGDRKGNLAGLDLAGAFQCGDVVVMTLRPRKEGRPELEALRFGWWLLVRRVRRRGERPVWTIVGVSLLPQAPESLALYFSAKKETRHFAFSPVHSCAFDCEGLEK